MNADIKDGVDDIDDFAKMGISANIGIAIMSWNNNIEKAFWP